MYIVYILYSNYIGFIGEEIKERIRKHNSNHKGFTGGKSDWMLVWSQNFEIKTEAMKKKLKVGKAEK